MFGTSPFGPVLVDFDSLGLGTMALQDADNVAIIGGAIDGTAIGGTTPAAVEATLLHAGVEVITKATDATLTADECRGQVVLVTATATITLPAVADCVEGAVVTIYSTTAAAVHIDPNADDRIILDGIALDDGDKLTSAGAAGDHITSVADSTAGWTTLGRSGTWTDGG